MHPASARRAYLEEIGSLVLRLKGGGLTLSPLDADRIRDWHQRGIPMEQALLAVQRAHEGWCAGGRRSGPFPLARAERLLPAGRPGPAPARPTPTLPAAAAAPPAAEDPAAAVAASLERSGRGAAGPARKGYEAALAALRCGGLLEERLLRADWALAAGYYAALPPALRRHVAGEATARLGPRRGIARRQYRLSLRAALADAACNHGSLRRPTDMLP